MWSYSLISEAYINGVYEAAGTVLYRSVGAQFMELQSQQTPIFVRLQIESQIEVMKMNTVG